MKYYYTITKTMTYDLNIIMENENCDRDTAIEIAYSYFNKLETDYDNCTFKLEEIPEKE